MRKIMVIFMIVYALICGSAIINAVTATADKIEVHNANIH